MYRRAVIFGSPWTPTRRFPGVRQLSWQYSHHDSPTFWNDKTFTPEIMEKYPLSILLTSCPPRYHLDGDSIDPHHGNFSLLRELWRTTPTLHVFNNVPNAAGQTTLYWNRAQQAYEDAWYGTEWQDFYSREAALDKDIDQVVQEGSKARLRLKMLVEKDIRDTLRELFSLGAWKDLFLVLIFGLLGLFTHRIGKLRGEKKTQLVNASVRFDQEGEVEGTIQVVQV
ncbi:hypothetical protein K491DRAFT_691349 [Lophiostoma macrostomum CBS 122681]|uniref:Uncharacterized protein n=1 Tax=Lophiostoma macrostomum CBS 122681 TaxID=1314788 RepID=A0A6A6TBE6_9PLEO|nr:hypothetical protein K491DRAFT_691349 [Lophiostoma macrostomum CBS 122681]